MASWNFPTMNFVDVFSIQNGGNLQRSPCYWANYNDQTAEVTLDGGLVREFPPNALNSGLGIILICPDVSFRFRVGLGR